MTVAATVTVTVTVTVTATATPSGDSYSYGDCRTLFHKEKHNNKKHPPGKVGGRIFGGPKGSGGRIFGVQNASKKQVPPPAVISRHGKEERKRKGVEKDAKLSSFSLLFLTFFGVAFWTTF